MSVEYIISYLPLNIWSMSAGFTPVEPIVITWKQGSSLSSETQTSAKEHILTKRIHQQVLDLSGRGSNHDLAALDYYEDRSKLDTYANHGWPDIIFEDEYPLEIQCQSCFTRFFLAKYESKWGPAWE